jgi:hypothetical protein
MAKEDIQIFVKAQKEDYATKCLHPSMDCEEKPICAHSIQNARVLDLIQTDGHILMPRYKLIKGEPVLKFKKIGRNDASTFTGLCSKHDTELFKAIDTEPLDVDNCEHLRQLAYRSVMREMHTHLANGERAWAMHETFCKEQEVDPSETVTGAFLLFADHNKRAQDVYRYRRKHFDKPREDGKVADLRHLVIEMDNQKPVLAASSLFSTGFTEEGDIIGPTLNILPLNETKSVAIISCPAEQEAAVEASLAKVFDADEKTLKYELAKLVIQRVENFTLSPAHYDTWSEGKQARVLQQFEASLKDPKDISDHPDLNNFS